MDNIATAVKPLTEQEIKAFAIAWYDMLDIHAPAEECYRMLADDELNMVFPEAVIHDVAEFGRLYEGWTRLYFDENHSVQSVTSTINGTEAQCEVIVGWQASWFPAPAPKSKRTSLNAVQQWKVRRSSKNRYSVEMAEYRVLRFDYAPGLHSCNTNDHTTERDSSARDSSERSPKHRTGALPNKPPAVSKHGEVPDPQFAPDWTSHACILKEQECMVDALARNR